MSRRDRRLCKLAVLAAALSAGCWSVWIASPSPALLCLVLAVHLALAGLTALLVASNRRGLAFALGASVPVLGPVAAVFSYVIAGRGGADLLGDPRAASTSADRADLARRLTAAIPVCEALASTDTAARRQALAKLKARGSADDISVLRWARARHGGDTSIEAALAFEEVCTRFEQRAEAARVRAEAEPSYASHAAAFEILCEGIESGTVDGPLVAHLVEEATRHHAAAIAFDPLRARELLAARVRLALTMHRPEEALDLLDIATTDADLKALHREAAYAARRFDLVPEVMREAY